MHKFAILGKSAETPTEPKNQRNLLVFPLIQFLLGVYIWMYKYIKDVEKNGLVKQTTQINAIHVHKNTSKSIF